MRSPFVWVCLIQFPPVKSIEIVVHIGIKPLVLVQIQHPSISKKGPKQVAFLYTQTLSAVRNVYVWLSLSLSLMALLSLSLSLIEYKYRSSYVIGVMLVCGQITMLCSRVPMCRWPIHRVSNLWHFNDDGLGRHLSLMYIPIRPNE